MSEKKIAKRLDTSGFLCPLPIVKTFKAMKELEVGDLLEMISTDAGSMPDMQAWANQTKHELVEAEELDGGKYRFLVKKTH